MLLEKSIKLKLSAMANYGMLYIYLQTNGKEMFHLQTLLILLFMLLLTTVLSDGSDMIGGAN